MRNKRTKRQVARQPIDLFPQTVIEKMIQQKMAIGKPMKVGELVALKNISLN